MAVEAADDDAVTSGQYVTAWDPVPAKALPTTLP
jgi:hypothetical protein